MKKLYTVAQMSVDNKPDHLSETMWAQCFKTLQEAKQAIEDDVWKNFCNEWEDNLEYFYDKDSHSEWEDLIAPPFVDWQNWGWCWVGFLDHYDLEYTIMKTELV